jgi:Subtilase family
MKCFFESHRDDERAGSDEDDSAPGLDGVPAALLARHGARVLVPADAAAVRDWPAARSTVYRARTLLVPGDLMQGAAFGAINRTLTRVGMSIVPAGGDSPGGDTPGGDTPGGDTPGIDGIRARMPRTAVLVPAPPANGEASAPVVIDAWVALQMLRAAAAAQEDSVLDEQAVRRISLEHLLVGSAITGTTIEGSPISSGGGGISGGGSDNTDSYLYSGGDGRTPVELSIDPPARSSAAHCELVYGRRPVIAVLDTGARTHPWLDVRADPRAPGGYSTIADGFVAVDQGMQHTIYVNGEQAAAAGDQPRRPVRHPWDTPVTADPLIGELDTHTGHGTFIAGIVRQTAPDAQVLALRIMHSDGIVYEGDLTCALGLLADRVTAAEKGDPAAMVDVVSLSLGYFSESSADLAQTSGLRTAIDTLLRMGVVVVAAAGNFSTSRKFYPAAFAGQPMAPGQAPLISVGALNPNGSKALFSDGGRWITAWAPGAAMISTFPTDVNGSRDPSISMAARPAGSIPAGRWMPAQRAALDPDDYSGGFAIWSGTSFSAPQVAAQIARELLAGAAADPALRLDQPGGPAAVRRAAQALHHLGWQA